MFCTPIIDITNEFGIPTYVFFMSNAGLLGFIFHFQNLHDHHNQDFTEFKDSDAELSFTAFAYPVPVKSLEVDKTIQKIYPVGPVRNLKRGGGGPNEVQSSQSEADIIRWLDDQDPASVVFICFESMGGFDVD
ncbi:hypothetical protein TEA_007965 [Camellia sinensis var. sinensis]|uniref:Uncharacterized protein n=1 Tax=Camellia sinensis var. sinensis TaxID=542762 RepID=A0A4S4EUT3_CAMSN|nr:hypothetical protein TEA_007965 [Camellia sinensis var. sinensis]